MKLAEALCVKSGVTAMIGSGGKTTLLRELARELAEDGSTVVLTTTTHILPFADVATAISGSVDVISRELARHKVICLGEPSESGKLAAPGLSPDVLAQIADYVLVEADGSRQLPLKAHADWEPVVPSGCSQTILVVGASGLNKPIARVVHRPEIFCRAVACSPTDAATPERVAAVVRTEALPDRVAINQADDPDALLAARELAGLFDYPTCYGSFLAHDLSTR